MSVDAIDIAALILDTMLWSRLILEALQEVFRMSELSIQRSIRYCPKSQRRQHGTDKKNMTFNVAMDATKTRLRKCQTDFGLDVVSVKLINKQKKATSSYWKVRKTERIQKGYGKTRWEPPSYLLLQKKLKGINHDGDRCY